MIPYNATFNDASLDDTSLESMLYYADCRIKEITQNGLLTIGLSDQVETHLNFTDIGE